MAKALAVPLRDIAKEYGLDRSALRKYLKRKGIETCMTRTEEGGWQRELALTPEAVERLRIVREQDGYCYPPRPIVESADSDD